MKIFNYTITLQAVTDTEWSAVQMMYSDWQEKKLEDGTLSYLEAFFERNGCICRVVAAKQNEMGMTAATATSMRLIEHFRPIYLFMVGIAAGIALCDVIEQIYGDVIVADMVWNYSAGKFVSSDRAEILFGSIGFIPRPTTIRLLEGIRPFVEAAVQSEENECHVVIGPMACGHSVVANKEIVNRQIHYQYKHTLGLDMESYAVAYAAQHAAAPQPKALIIKSICDFADSRKSDQYQQFAAYTSSSDE